MTYRIASRKSLLAVKQAQDFIKEIKRLDPGAKIQYEKTSSLGDRNLDWSLEKAPAKAVFTSDLTEKLLAGDCDAVVHSWKDLPIDPTPGTCVLGILDRADPRDVLFVKRSSILSKSKKLVFLTSSPRRKFLAQKSLRKFLPWDVDDMSFKNIRGNIPTRFEKFQADKEADGFFMAKAAWDRLNETEEWNVGDWESWCNWMVLPLEDFPCAPAQGGLALEIRAEDRSLWSKFENLEMTECIGEERRELKKLGGGCHTAFGASSIKREFGKILYKQGLAPGTKGAISSIDIEAKDQLGLQKSLKHQGPVLWSTSSLPSFWDRSSVDLDKTLLDEMGVSACYISKFEDHLVRYKERFQALRALLCAGIKTWEKLAKQGIWVHSCSESLGVGDEWTGLSLGMLVKNPPEKYLYQTHKSAPDVVSPWQKCVTYELLPRTKPSSDTGLNIPKEATHIFWSSSSFLQKALVLYKDDLEFKNKFHFCGPGRTYQVGSKFLDMIPVLSESEWRKKFERLV